jgi:hypothetical protein
LTSTPSRVSLGSTPRFRLVVTNVSHSPVRFLPPGRHPSYYRFTVERNGRPYEMGGPILDPLAPRPEWFVTLQPGEGQSFLVASLLADFQEAPKGRYTLRLRMSPLWQCLCEWTSTESTFFIQ